MRVLNVNSSLDTITGGGTAERTFQMSHFLALQGVKCTVLTIGAGLDEPRILAIKPAEVVVVTLLWGRYYIPIISWKIIKRLVNDADIIHFMGHWGVLNAIVYFAVRMACKPYVVCPAGALPIYGRSKWLKRLYNFIVGNHIVRNASGWIAVTSAEYPHFESYGIPDSKVTVIPNGISSDEFSSADIETFRSRYGLPENPIILFMGRLNPIKGPDLLLQAFVLMQNRFPEYHLVFAGPDEGMLPMLTDIARQHDLLDRVHFIGFVSGSVKSAAYHAAALLVIPSRQEAMSIVALEAAICGTPVMLTDQCGFGEIKSVHSGLEVQADSSSIADGLIFLLSQPETLKEIGNSLQKFVIKTYTWQFIIKKYLALYNDLLKNKINTPS